MAKVHDDMTEGDIEDEGGVRKMRSGGTLNSAKHRD